MKHSKYYRQCRVAIIIAFKFFILTILAAHFAPPNASWLPKRLAPRDATTTSIITQGLTTAASRSVAVASAVSIEASVSAQQLQLATAPATPLHSNITKLRST